MRVSPTPVETVKQFLADPTNPEIIRTVVAQDATYVSLNRESPELKNILPWASTSKGPQAFIDTFTRVFPYWENQNLHS
jgi:hypothetical protein